MNTTTHNLTAGTKIILADATPATPYRYNWATVEKVTKTQVTVGGRKFHLGTNQPGAVVARQDKGDYWVIFPWDAHFAANAIKADHAEVAGIAAIS